MKSSGLNSERRDICGMMWLTKLSAPVSQVVESVHCVAHGCINVRHKIPNDGGTQVASMEGFGNVGGTGNFYQKQI